jgi:uncharacterized protein YuzE
MKIEFDPATDLLQVRLLAGIPIAETKENEGMRFGYAADRRIVQIEIRGAQGRIDGELLKLIGPAFAKPEV